MSRRYDMNSSDKKEDFKKKPKHKKMEPYSRTKWKTMKS